MEGIITFTIAVCILFVIIIVGLAKFNNGIDDSWRHQIVEHGCAEYYLDGKNERQWRWK